MRKYIMVLGLLITLVSCTTSTPIPTVIPTQTATPKPTETLLPTLTSTPTLPPTVDVFSAMLPSGTPEAEWRGIPIMPGAINGGEGENDSYVFTTKTSVDEVEAYYEKELAKLGWDLLTSGTGDNGNVMMIFNNGKPPFMPISILSNGNLTLVLIVTSQ